MWARHTAQVSVCHAEGQQGVDPLSLHKHSCHSWTLKDKAAENRPSASAEERAFPPRMLGGLGGFVACFWLFMSSLRCNLHTDKWTNLYQLDEFLHM